MDKATVFQYLSEFIWHHLFKTRLSLVLWPFEIREKKNFPSCRHVGLSRAVAPGSGGRSGWKGTGLQHSQCWKERNCWRGSFCKRKHQETFYFSDAATERSATSRLWISLNKDKSSFQEKDTTVLALVPKPLQTLRATSHTAAAGFNASTNTQQWQQAPDWKEECFSAGM